MKFAVLLQVGGPASLFFGKPSKMGGGREAKNCLKGSGRVPKLKGLYMGPV